MQKTVIAVTNRPTVFNTQIICIPCKGKEKENPRYEEAARIEREEIQKGNLNFEGIGL